MPGKAIIHNRVVVTIEKFFELPNQDSGLWCSCCAAHPDVIPVVQRIENYTGTHEHQKATEEHVWEHAFRSLSLLSCVPVKRHMRRQKVHGTPSEHMSLGFRDMMALPRTPGRPNSI
eukprot:4625299-Amphidinium_carterae.1